MCTFSLIPVANGFRAIVNRDELNSRPRAMPPVVVRAGGHTLMYPIDPRSGGTWVGVNDAGLLLALLNVSHGERSTRPQYSRGLIIPPLLEFDRLSQALAALVRVDARTCQPFRLVAVQGQTLGIVGGDGRRVTADTITFDAPRMFTSSSLGDVLVDAPRRQLFDEMVVGSNASPLDAQARFHRHRWPDRPELSVSMSRADASTVSRSLLDVAADGITFDYEPNDAMRRAA